MATQTGYYPGGFIAAAPQQNRSHLFDSVAGTYTEWDQAGTQTLQRALTSSEVAVLAQVDASAQEDANKATLRQLAAAASVANPQDVAQDQAAVTSAAAISGTTGTLTALQLSNAVRQLAQGIALLAQNDVNTKKELNVLIRLALGLFDGTS